MSDMVHLTALEALFHCVESGAGKQREARGPLGGVARAGERWWCPFCGAGGRDRWVGLRSDLKTESTGLSDENWQGFVMS